MGLLSHRVERSEIAAGDHIYTWRSLYAYSHHGLEIIPSSCVEDMIVFNGLYEPIEIAIDDEVEPIEAAAMDDEVCEGEITRDQVDVPASKRQRCG